MPANIYNPARRNVTMNWQ